MLMASLVLLALTSPILWLLRPHRWRHSGWLAALPPAAVTIWLFTQLGPISQGQVLADSYVWSEAFGLVLQLRLDGLALLFGLIIAGIGTAIAVYTGYYFENDPKLGYFYALLYLFMTSMLGLVWADNLLVLYVFWEGTSITSYLLISFKSSDEEALEGARRALIVTGLGALAMLAGMVLLAEIAGTYTISEILRQSPAALAENSLLPAVLILFLLGAFTKSAQFPFHFWLPGAMAAPTPASAYLHSATMVKAGVYLLARLHPAFGEHPIWFWSLLLVGSATMLLGGVSALRYYDMKAILAYATVSQLGVLTMLLAFSSEAAYTAVTVGILAHALYKGPLFLVAGIVDHATGTRDLRHLAQLGRTLPWVAATAVLASVSMAGFPPTFGFLAKEALLETWEKYAESGGALIGWIGFGAGAVIGVLFVAYSLRLLWDPFFRQRAPKPAAPVDHAPSLFFVAPALILALIGTVIPFALGPVEKALFDPAASAVSGEKIEMHLALWHGWTPVLLTSLGAIMIGVLLFLIRDRVTAAFAYVPAWLNATYLFDQVTTGLFTLARWSTRTVQGIPLEAQIGVTLLGAVAFVVYALAAQGLTAYLALEWRGLPPVYEIMLPILAIIAAAITVRTQSRLSAIISIGIVGVVVTLIFVFYSAPDLALTQLLIEVLTVVLLVLVYYRIPSRPHPPPTSFVRWRNRLIAGAVALWGFVMVLLSAETPLYPPISDFFSLNSVPAAHGGNIVNVILVDFRGFDTMGEITVLAIAAVGGYGLLRASRLRPVRRLVAPLANQKEAPDA